MKRGVPKINQKDVVVTDPRVLRSRAGLSQALLELLESTPLEQITIRDIAATAGVGFTTYYRHYPSKEALLQDLAACAFSPMLVERVISQRFGSLHGTAAAALCGPLAALSQVCRFACETLAPNLAKTTDESRHLLAALEGRYVPAGPSGSPSRGMAHVLPTGRNFYTVDPRALPTPAAWSTGSALAREALARH